MLLRECKSNIQHKTLCRIETHITCRLILLAVYCLCIGHPGLVQGAKAKDVSRGASDEETMSERKTHSVVA